MELALYDPEDGYYATAADRGSRRGDFLTAPEMHPIFGRALARAVAEMWERLERPARFVVREEGAGSGVLAIALLRQLRDADSAAWRAVRYAPVESTPARTAAARAAVDDAGLARCLATDAEAERFVGVMLANELVDALPVHRLVARAGQLRELYTTWRDGRFTDQEGPPSSPLLGETLAAAGITLADGQRAEVRPAAEAWLRGASERLERGYLVVIDYGDEAAALYGTARAGGTLAGYRGQRVTDDPYTNVGATDLTAHVDFTQLARAGRAAGMEIVGRTSQAALMAGLGLAELLVEEGRRGTDLAAYRLARSACVRLLDPRALGGFGVLVLGRSVALEPPLRALSFTMPSRRL